ncbi:MAG: hypothetical protein ACK4OM_03820 [Alphaproteobacteria bacterium]
MSKMKAASQDPIDSPEIKRNKLIDYRLKLVELKLPALDLTGDRPKTITIDLANIYSIISVQPGLTPPSQAPYLSKEFLETPGAKGCTGAAMKISEICQKNSKIGYILSNKPLNVLINSYIENKANADKDGKTNPFKNLILISDEENKLANFIGKEYLQEIYGKQYYKRFTFEINYRQIKNIKLDDLSIQPSISAENRYKNYLNPGISL